MSDSSEKRRNDPGTVAEKGFVYEIMWLRLLTTLTSLDEVRKIKGIQGTKEKTASALSLVRH